ncbi:MAG: guanine nucleotide exchange factor [Satyrvirus sp.]|uniref:Guanine nucleotide exchange factor n=1 Tax=Satyrvirus sp. TaxID=2487771 RepID=A0A3G5ADJ3_9VIRU|nr:MAG: guanine nucleotide exchange factor [Satyrvirus sp.]
MFNLEIIKIKNTSKIHMVNSVKISRDLIKNYNGMTGSARPIMVSDKYNSIDDINSKQFSDELTRIFMSHLTNMNSQEIALAVISQNDEYDYEKCPELFILKEYFNGLSCYIPKHIFELKSNEERIKSIIKFIKIAKNLKKSNNLQGLVSIMAGLSLNSVQRIKPLWEEGSKHEADYRELSKITTPLTNWSVYRNYLNSIKNGKIKNIIPYIGLVTSDIKHVSEFGLYNLEKKCVNINKYQEIVKLMNSFESCRNCKLNHSDEDKKISDFIKDLLIKYQIEMESKTQDKWDNEMYAKSVEIYKSVPTSKSIACISTQQSNNYKNRLQLLSLRRNSKYDLRSEFRADLKPEKCSMPEIKFKHQNDLLISEPPQPPYLINQAQIMPKNTMMDMCSNSILNSISNSISSSSSSSSSVQDECTSLDSSKEHIFYRKNRSKSFHVDDTSKNFPIKRYSLNFNIHHDFLVNKINIYQNIEGYEFIKIIHVESWSCDHVCSWLKFLGLKEYINIFHKNKIHGYVLVDLTDKHLKNHLRIDILGDRMRILKAIKELKN